MDWLCQNPNIILLKHSTRIQNLKTHTKEMALSTHLPLHIKPPPVPSLLKSHRSSSSILPRNFLIPSPCHRKPIMEEIMMKPQAASVQSAVSEVMNLIQSSPPTWQSAILSNLLIFLLGSPILVSGLSVSGIAAAFLLGTLTWRAFGSSGFLLVATYFVIVSEKSLAFMSVSVLWRLIQYGSLSFLLFFWV